MRLPDFHDPALRATRPEEIHVGLSGARVFRLRDGGGRPVAVFKCVPSERPDLMRELELEAVRSDWLGGSGLTTPRLLEHGSDDRGRGFRWTVSAHVPGTAAHEPVAVREHPRLVERLAEVADRIHRSSPGPVVEARPLDGILERARDRVASGLVERSWRGTGRSDADPARALAAVERLVERAGRLPEVVTHGDFCLPNVLITPAGAWGLVDLGKAGPADPHTDLAAMVGSLRNRLNPHFGEADVDRFLDSYGRNRVDPELLYLHSEVDAFFWPV
ncbi:phosphotransferase [Nocardiopsis oceani]